MFGGSAHSYVGWHGVPGPTIEESALGRIFDPLRRGPNQEGDGGADGGLGLGLYIVREVALAHGGDVVVRSDRRETVFTVRLPRRVENLSR